MRNAFSEYPKSPQKDILPAGVHIHDTHGKNLTGKDFDELKIYLTRQQNESQLPDPTHPDFIARLESATNNSFAMQYFREAKNTNPDSLITFVRNADGTLIGLCITIVEEKNAKLIGSSLLIGFSWDYQGLGIGTVVLRKHLTKLKKEGVREVSCNTREASKRLVEKSGFPFTADPKQPTLLTVHLKP